MTSIAGGHGETNPNSSWLSARGFWLAYFLGLLLVHLLLLSVPFVTIPLAWTITNLLHNAVSNGKRRKKKQVNKLIIELLRTGTPVFPAYHQRRALAEHRERRQSTMDPLGANR